MTLSLSLLFVLVYNVEKATYLFLHTSNILSVSVIYHAVIDFLKHKLSIQSDTQRVSTLRGETRCRGAPRSVCLSDLASLKNNEIKEKFYLF